MENKEWKPQDFSKEKTAVALSYDPNDIAPKIVATGKGHVAEKIITSAKENDVPFYQDGKLADTLSKFEVVAEILVFVDGMEKVKAKLDGRK